jgi:hypothetical protein
MAHNKQVLIIGSMNAVAYKEIFPLIRDNELWLGATAAGKDMVFAVPAGYPVSEKDRQKAARLGYVGDFTRLGNANWFTNLDHGRRHQPISLMTMEDNLKYNRKLHSRFCYEKFDNYDAIEVPFTDAIPSDYSEAMGVPLSFLDKYNPEQFEILGTSANGIVDEKYRRTPGLTKAFVDDYYKAGGTGAYKQGNPTAGYYENGVAKMAYQRIFIRHRRSA